MSLVLAVVGLLSLSASTHEVAGYAAAEQVIRERLAEDASRVPLFAELAILFASRSAFDGKRWLWQAQWVLARARDVAIETKASHRDRALIENAAGVVALAGSDALAARERFDEAAAIDPTYGPGQLNRGVMAVHARDHDTAIEALGAGLRDRRFAGDVDANLALAHALAKDGQHVRALEVLRSLVHRSEDPHIDLVLAIVLMDDSGPAAQGRNDRFVTATGDEMRVALQRYLATKPTNATLVIAAEQRLTVLEDREEPVSTHGSLEREAAALEAEFRAREAKEKARLRRLEAELLGQQQ